MFSQRNITETKFTSLYSEKRERWKAEGEKGKKNYSESKDENIHQFKIFFF